MCSIWQESYICEAKWLLYKIRMDFEFKLLVKWNKFVLELLRQIFLKTQLLLWEGHKFLYYVKWKSPHLFTFSRNCTCSIYEYMCSSKCWWNCHSLQFLLFSCVYVLIIFLHQTAFGLLSCRVIHRCLSIEFGCCFFSCLLVACIHSQQRKCSALKILRVELNHSLPET